VTRKYGKDCVSQIVTFGTLAAKGVIRDVGRVLDVPYAKCDTLAKLVPNELNMTLDRALETSPELKKMYDNDEDAHRIITMSKRLEGLPRHASMHAAGVVISSKPVEEFVPLSRSSDGSITTQFTMTTIEELGLLKMDFLGLRTLTVIKDACCSAMKNYGVSLDPATLDYDDKNIYDMISQGDTAGIFQLESGGMTSFMKSLKPTCLEDIIAGVALYRPGPMDFIPKYIDGKRHPERVSYDCPEMEPILKPTYGCIVYQEQVMQIVRDLAGYSMGRSDLVRRAMSKKKTAVMEKERQNFVYGNPEEQIPGCIARGISEATANHIYDEMIDFAKYAFNKSHAACYAVVSYQTAYLKYYYPAEFFAALMTSFMDNISKTAEYIEDVREMGIPILAPDVNEAEVGFSVSNGAIRYGLSAVKGVGRTAAEQIIRERELHGRYRDLEDFVVRVSERNINRRAIEYFILSGALDAFSGNRREKFAILPTILENKVKEKKDSMAGQMTLADLLGEDNAEAQEFKIRMPKLKEYPKEELLQFERDALGVYLSGHPLDQYRELMNRNCTASTADFRLDPDTAQVKLPDGQRVTVGGLITDVRTKTTKKNEQMAFLMLEDLVGTIEVLVFPRIYQDARAALVTDGKILIRGRVSQGDDADAKLIAESITAFEDVPRNLWLQFDTMETYKAKWQQAENVLFEHPGSNRVMVYLRQEKAVKHVRQDEAVRISDELMEALKAQLGEENVKVTWEVLKKVQR
jgi:DNA polymerase-3 subunit alpha